MYSIELDKLTLNKPHLHISLEYFTPILLLISLFVFLYQHHHLKINIRMI